MPSLMATKACLLKDGELVPDEEWRASAREMFFHLFRFLQDNGLVTRKLVRTLADTEDVTVRFGDLTSEGQAFIMSLAAERWLASFDRPGSKKSRDDIRYLETQLKKMRG
jgi:hypothetical protein